MKKLMCTFFLIAVFSVTAQSKVTKDLGDFTTLKVFNGIEVELIKSNNQKIEITGKKSEIVKLKNVNGVLKISLPFSLKPENNSANGEVIAKVFYSKIIDTIDANEGATITGKEIRQEHLEVKAQERAFVNLTIDTKDLVVKTTSGGIVKLSGETINKNIHADLYGVFNGFNLKTTSNSTVFAGTGARAEVLAGKILNAKVNFGGSIFYKGNPEVLQDKKVIGGIIQKRD